MRRVARPLLYVVTASVVLGLAWVHAKYIGDYNLTRSFRLSWSIFYIGALCLAAYGVGLPDEPRDAYEALWSAVRGTVFAALSISTVQLVAGSQVLPRAVVFWSALLLVPLWTLCCFIAARGRRREGRRDRVVFVLSEQDAESLRHDFKLAPERRAVLAAARTVDEVRTTASRQLPLLELAEAERASLVVLDRGAQAEPSIVSQAAQLHERGVRVRTLSLFYEEWFGKLPISELERVSLLFDIRELHRTTYGRAKRLFDLALALPAALLMVVATPLVVLGNAIANRGPLFYRQTRVGKNGVPFTILKFRTMRPGAAGLVDEWTTESDPRITPFGLVLRRTHLDEVPQVLNVVKGDLSVVGPRPEQPRYVEELTGKIPFYAVRHLVRPGVTGWAQVKYGYAGNEVDALQKLQYEFFYLRHQSLAFDGRIVARTIRSVTRARGR